MDNKGPFGIYDESFDLDGDGELNATEFDYMMDELYDDGDTVSNEDDGYLSDDDDEEEDEDDWDYDAEDQYDEDDDDDDWGDSDDDTY